MLIITPLTPLLSKLNLHTWTYIWNRNKPIKQECLFFLPWYISSALVHLYWPLRVLLVPVLTPTASVGADLLCWGADTVIRHKIPAALPVRSAGCRDYKGSVIEGVITVRVCLHVSPVGSSLLFLQLTTSTSHTHIQLRPAFCLPSVIGKCF